MLAILIFILGVLVYLYFARYSRCYCSKFKLSEFEKELRKKPLYKRRVVISLTTVPSRIDHIYPTLASLMDQTLRAHEIALNIPWKDRKGNSYFIPRWIFRLKYVKVYRIEKDYGPASKLIPTLEREEDETMVIAVDDDIIYHNRAIEGLVKTYEKNRMKAAVTNFGITLRKNNIIPGPFAVDRILSFLEGSKKVDLVQGFSGFLVTKAMFPPEAFNILSTPEAISVDDIWFSGWLKRNGIKIKSTGRTILRLPLINVNPIIKEVSLGRSENKGYLRDQKVVYMFF